METTLKYTLKVDATTGKAELRGFSEEMRRAGTGAEDMSRKGKTAADTFGTSLSALKGFAGALGLTFGAVQIVSILRDWTRESILFGQMMANVDAILDSNTVTIGQLRKQLLDLGGTMGSAAELADALYEAIGAGIEPAKAVQFVAEATKLAKAQLFEAGDATRLLATIMNAYGREVTNVSHVSDVFSKTIQVGIVRGGELANALGGVISTAAMAGVSIEEVAASIAIMTRAGINADEATTALNQALLTFISPSEKSAKVAKELGIELNATTLQTLGFKGSMDLVAKATGGNIGLINELFENVRAGKAVMALTGAQAADFSKILDEMKNSTGATNEAFEKQTGTLGAQMKALWINLKTAFIDTADAVGLELVPTLKGLNMVLEGMDERVWKAYEGMSRVGGGFAAITKAAQELGIDLHALTQTEFTNLLIKMQETGDRSSTLTGLAKEQGRAWLEQASNVDKLTASFASMQNATQRQAAFNDVLAELRTRIVAAYKEGQTAEDVWKRYGVNVENLAGIAKKHTLYLDEGTLALIANMAEVGKKVKADEAAARAIRGLTEEEKKLAKATEEMRWKIEAAWRKETERDIEAHAKAVEAVTQAMEKGLRPADEMVDTLTLALEQYSEADVVRVYGDEILEAARKQEAMGQSLPAIIAGLRGAAAEMKIMATEALPMVKGKLDSMIVTTLPDWATSWSKTTRENTESVETMGDSMKQVWADMITDLSKGIAESIIHWKGFWSTLKSIAQDFAEAILRSIITPFLNSVIKGFTSLFSAAAGGAGGGGGGGAVAGTAGAAGGAGLSAGIGGLFGGITSGIMAVAAAIPVWGWAVAGIVAGLTAVWAIFKKNPFEEFAQDLARDFGGIEMAKDAVEAFGKSLGLTGKQIDGIRKDLQSSPVFLKLAYEAAEAQGKTEAFLASLEHIETAWGTFNFREVFEIGLDTGNWDRLNQAFVDAFACSERLRAVLPDLTRLFLENGTAVGSTARQMEGLLKALASLDQRLDDLRAKPELVASELTFLQTSGATTAEILELLGSDIASVVDMFRRGLIPAIPAVIQAFLDMLTPAQRAALGLQELANATDAATEAARHLREESNEAGAGLNRMGREAQAMAEHLRGLARASDAARDSINRLRDGARTGRDALDMFRNIITQSVLDWRKLRDAGLELTEEIYWLGVELLKTMKPAEAQRLLWQLMGNDIVALANQYTTMRLAIPPLIQQTLDWAVANGLLMRTEEGLYEAIDAVNRAMQTGRQAAADLLSGSTDLADQLQGYAEGLLLGLRVEQAQQMMWDTKKDQILEHIRLYTILGLPIDDRIRQMYEWAYANGEVTRSWDEFIASIRAGEPLIAASVQAWRNFTAAGVLLEREVISLGEELLVDHKVVDAQRILWMQMGDAIAKLASEYRLYGLELPPVIQMALDLATANGWLTESQQKLVGAVENTTNSYKKLSEVQKQIVQEAQAIAAQQEAGARAALVRESVSSPISLGVGVAITPEGMQQQAIRNIQMATGMSWDQATALYEAAAAEYDADTLFRATRFMVQWDVSELAKAMEVVQAVKAGANPETGLAFMPQFQHGGFVPSDMIAMVHAGETVLTPPQMSRLLSMIERGTLEPYRARMPEGEGQPRLGDQINIKIEGPVYGLDDLETKVAEAWQRRARLGGFKGMAARIQ